MANGSAFSRAGMAEVAILKAFRSPLLMALPKDRDEGARQRMARRFSISALCLTAIFAVFFLVHQELLPVGPFYWLYWLHDNIYLFLKGLIFKRYYPWSLAWIGVGLTLLAIAWLTFVAGKSPLQVPHAFLVRWASRNAGMHGFLTGVAELFKRMGLPMNLMRSAIEVERADQLEQMFQRPDPSASRRLQHKFLRQTDLWIALAQTFRDEPGVSEEALSMGLSTLLWVEPISDKQAQRVEHQILNRMVARLVRFLPLPKDSDAFHEAIAFPGDFRMQAIALDALLLFSEFVPDGKARLSQALEDLEKDRVDFGELVRLRLIQSAEDRLAMMETMRLDLESTTFGTATVRKLRSKLPDGDDLSDARWSDQAYQAMLLACHAARMQNDPHLLARYLTAVEALTVAAESVSPSPDSPMADLRDHSLALTQDLPSTEIYRFAAQLFANMEHRDWSERRQVVWPERIVGTGHQRDAWSLARTFRLASGREGERMVEPEVAP